MKEKITMNNCSRFLTLLLTCSLGFSSPTNTADTTNTSTVLFGSLATAVLGCLIGYKIAQKTTVSQNIQITMPQQETVLQKIKTFIAKHRAALYSTAGGIIGLAMGGSVTRFLPLFSNNQNNTLDQERLAANTQLEQFVVQKQPVFRDKLRDDNLVREDIDAITAQITPLVDGLKNTLTAAKNKTEIDQIKQHFTEQVEAIIAQTEAQRRTAQQQAAAQLREQERIRNEQEERERAENKKAQTNKLSKTEIIPDIDQTAQDNLRKQIPTNNDRTHRLATEIYDAEYRQFFTQQLINQQQFDAIKKATTAIAKHITDKRSDNPVETDAKLTDLHARLMRVIQTFGAEYKNYDISLEDYTKLINHLLRLAVDNKKSEQDLDNQHKEFLKGIQTNKIPLKKPAGNVEIGNVAKEGMEKDSTVPNTAENPEPVLTSHNTAAIDEATLKLSLECHDYYKPFIKNIIDTNQLKLMTEAINEAYKKIIASRNKDATITDAELTDLHGRFMFVLTTFENTHKNVLKDDVYTNFINKMLKKAPHADLKDLQKDNKDFLEYLEKNPKYKKVQ